MKLWQGAWKCWKTRDPQDSKRTSITDGQVHGVSAAVGTARRRPLSEKKHRAQNDHARTAREYRQCDTQGRDREKRPLQLLLGGIRFDVHHRLDAAQSFFHCGDVAVEEDGVPLALLGRVPNGFRPHGEDEHCRINPMFFEHAR